MLDMGRTPCCDKQDLKRGSWTEEEDQKLVSYIRQHGEGGWRYLPEKAGLLRCGKSCRLRWANYLRPGIKRGEITPEEEQTIIQLHSVLGNRWSTIARHLYKRTDNEIKNYWNTRLKKRVAQIGSSTCSPSSGATITTVDHHVADHDQTGVISIPSSITDQNLANPDHNITIFDDSLQVENKQGAILSCSTPTRSSHFGPSISSPSNTSSDFDQVARPASSSARILLNKIASSKLTLLNLPHVVIYGGGSGGGGGGGGGRGESQVEGTDKGNNVAELSSCGGCDSGSLASSRPSNVDPLDDASPAQQSTGFSAFCADNIDDLEQYWLSGTSE